MIDTLLATTPATLQSLILLASFLAIAAAIAGTIAGFLGVGGGIIIVPALFFAFSYAGVNDDLRMHLAVGTSLGTMTVTATRSFLAHHRHGAADLTILRSWMLPVTLAAAAGGIASRAIDPLALTTLFGVIALIMATLILCTGDTLQWRKTLPPEPANSLIAAAIGALSSLMGIGGGTFSIALLTLCGKPIHQAIGTSSGLGILISVPGTIGFIIAGFGVADLPRGSLGYVNLIGCLLLIPITVIMAPLGAALTHRMKRQTLTRFFAIFLGCVAIRMLFDVW